MTDRKFLIVFVGPATVVVVLVLVLPLIVSLWSSLNHEILSDPASDRFVGFENYAHIFNDPNFWNSLRVTGLYFVGAVACTTVLGLFVALLLDRDMRPFNWVKSLYLLPLVITPVVVGIQWRFMLNYELGVLPWIAGTLGMPAESWLTQPTSALVWLIVVDIWNNTPVVILLFSAGLASIPTDVREAARMDGASVLQTTRYVILPLLRQTALVVLMIRSIGGLRAFDTIVAITNGGPGRATEVINLFNYRLAFRYFDIGQASALGWLMLLLAMALGTVYVRLLRTPTYS